MLTLTSPVETPWHRWPAGAKLAALCGFTVLLFALASPVALAACLAAITALIRDFGPPRRPLELVSLCEEEGSRFPTAGFWGSRAIVGKIAQGDIETVTEANGGSIAAAMMLGLSPAALATDGIDEIITGSIDQSGAVAPAAAVASADAGCAMAAREGSTLTLRSTGQAARDPQLTACLTWLSLPPGHPMQ